MSGARAHWSSRLGFVMAAAGSAVGLGNIWRFPYVAGENGGGWFVLIYLFCILFVGLPVMIGEILVGRMTQRSPVSAIRDLTHAKSLWIVFGWAGTLAAFMVLSVYSVVAGWTLHYAALSVLGVFHEIDPPAVQQIFVQDVSGSAEVNLAWHAIFMFITIFIVAAGVQQGIELSAKIMMPLLLLVMGSMLVAAIVGNFETGFLPALEFAFRLDEPPTVGSALQALGQAFFSLSVGMGAMITLGSYLRKDDDIVGTATIVCGLDTLIALLACFVVFPFVFAFGMEPAEGPGLVFLSLPAALSQFPGGSIWCAVFFLLLFMAALTSAISMLELVVSYFVDEWNWPRWLATLFPGLSVALFGIPAALSGTSGPFGERFQTWNAPLFELVGEPGGQTWSGSILYLVSNVMLPLGALSIAMFVAWRLDGRLRKSEFIRSSRLAWAYLPWLTLMRVFVPLGIALVFLDSMNVLDWIFGSGA